MDGFDRARVSPPRNPAAGTQMIFSPGVWEQGLDETQVYFALLKDFLSAPHSALGLKVLQVFWDSVFLVAVLVSWFPKVQKL